MGEAKAQSTTDDIMKVGSTWSKIQSRRTKSIDAQTSDVVPNKSSVEVQILEWPQCDCF